MKIVTVNCPESFIEAIKRLVGEGGLYPSRSELIRVAVREFLIRELKMAKNLNKHEEHLENEELDEENYVRVPIERKDTNGEPVREFHTYKIVRKLDY